MNTHLQRFNDPSVEFLGTFDGDDQEYLATLVGKQGLVIENGKIVGRHRVVSDDPFAQLIYEMRKRKGTKP